MSTALEAQSNIDNAVRRIVYDSFISRAASISRAEVAAELSFPESQVAASFKRLADAHMLVLQPESGQVLMASPFSAVPTAYRVRSVAMEWWTNCVWDALGVIAMIGHDGTVDTSCPDCGEALSLSVRADRLDPAEGLVHFTVPAAHWWDDIVFT